MTKKEKEEEDIPKKRERWDSSAIVQIAEEVGISVSDRNSLLKEIGRRLSSWSAFTGGLAVALGKSQKDEYLPLDLIDDVRKMKTQKDMLEEENRRIKKIKDNNE